jgi:plastocyanin
MRRFVLLSCAVLSLVMSAGATTWQVTVQDFEFVPSMLTINQGDTVVWTNVQGTHNVMHACGTPLFGTAIGAAPWVYQFVFSIPADYPYQCEVHPNIMMGVISVQQVPQRWNVTVQNFSFTPANLTVMQGDTVVWTNILGRHSVHHTGTPSLFDSGNPADAPWTYTLVVGLPPASYSYVCELHPTLMQGTLTVSVPPTAPAPPSDVVILRSGDNANLYWTTVSGANCYLIYITQNSADTVFTQLAGITGDSTFVQPITALPGVKYFFQVRAVGQ